MSKSGPALGRASFAGSVFRLVNMSVVVPTAVKREIVAHRNGHGQLDVGFF